MKKRSIGIIGFGRFGQLAAQYLKNHFSVFAGDNADKKQEARKLGVTWTSVEECAQKDVVLICVPISAFEKTLKQIIPFLRRNTMVLDVCSVKEKPVEAMERLIPPENECIGTHPLFGPDSVQNSLRGHKIVLCPIRTKCLADVKNFLADIGLTVFIASPAEHDEQMAKSLSLTHLLGAVLLEIGIERNELSTPTHERLMELVDIVKNDSEQLLLDMQAYNRFTKDLRKKLIDELLKLDRKFQRIGQ